jgi:hypothetical protein
MTGAAHAIDGGTLVGFAQSRQISGLAPAFVAH